MIKKIFFNYFELAFWVAVLISLAFTGPASQPHFSLCPLKWLGLTWCPGCGIGHAISFLFHGDIKASFHAHWLGIPAVIVILYRIWILVCDRLYFKPQFQINYIAAIKSETRPDSCRDPK